MEGKIQIALSQVYICRKCGNMTTQNSISADTPHFKRPVCGDCDLPMQMRETVPLRTESVKVVKKKKKKDK